MRPGRPIKDGYKICYKCNQNLPVSEYYKASRRKEGLEDWCKKCTKDRSKSYYKKNKRCLKNSQRLRIYGITESEYKKIFVLQGECCAICWTTNPNSKDWHIDHDHITNKVRGILCSDCNRLLGGARDNPNILKLGIKYLMKPGIVDIERVVA